MELGSSSNPPKKKKKTVKFRNPIGEIFVDERGHDQPEERIDLGDRIIERGIEHVRVLKKTNNDSMCDDEPKKKEPLVDRTIEEEDQAPYVIVVHGPPKVGKSLLIKSLVKHYTGHDVAVVAGSITLVLGNRRRIQLVEYPNNVNGMIDAAKYADAVIFMIDTTYGFEMETFEFLNILQVHGIPKIVGVFTYLDGIKDVVYRQRETKHLMDQFSAEIYEADLFCLSGLDQEMYRTEEIGVLANFIMNMEFHPSQWRAQPYVLTKYFEVDTSSERVNTDGECYRNIFLYGYLRGCQCYDIKTINKVYIAGVGDFPLFDVKTVPDPFPLPADTHNGRRFQVKKRFQIKGFRTGAFLRLEVRNVPFEMVKNLDPHQPVLVGFICSEEENLGYNQVTLELHDWHRKLLITRDPIIVSIGWRRYTTKPVYAKESCDGQLESLDYTPKDKQCVALFWGPLAPPETRAVVVQSLSDDKAVFRILATAVVHKYNHAATISKKVKVPCVFNPLMTASSNSIWQCTRDVPNMPDFEEEEPKSEMRKRLELFKKRIQEKRRKDFAAGIRQTPERRRAVRFVEGVPRDQTLLNPILNL